MIVLGNKLRLTEEEKKSFISQTGLPVPDTVEAYNAALEKTSASWQRIGEQENSAEAKFLAAVLLQERIEGSSE